MDTAKKVKIKSLGVWFLMGSLLVIFLIYFGITVFYSCHFLPGTTINGVDVSGKDVEEVERQIAQEVSSYEIKIQAARLLLDHVDHTFVTPVFNGSTSLRDAAGQLIENTVKSTRRGESIDEAYMEKLYHDVVSLYRLDQIGGQGSLSSGKTAFGPLPPTAVALLSALAVTWFLIILYLVYRTMKTRKGY